MIMLRRAQKLNQLLQSTNQRTIQSLSLLLRDSPRQYSTEIQSQSQSQSQSQPQPQPQPQPQSQPQSQSHSSTPIDSFLRSPQPKGSVYGQLLGISPNTLKTDVINLFEGCNLTLDDIKVDYNRMFHPMAMLVQFRSMSEFSGATRELSRKNRSFRLEKVVMDQQNWDLITPFNGRYVIFRGIPRNALMDDVERTLSGCNYDASSLEIFTRAMQPEPVRMAKVRFPSQVEAMNAVIRKNGAFCLNNRIVAQLIQ